MIELLLFVIFFCDRLRHKFGNKVFIALKYFCSVTSFFNGAYQIKRISAPLPHHLYIIIAMKRSTEKTFLFLIGHFLKARGCVYIKVVVAVLVKEYDKN